MTREVLLYGQIYSWTAQQFIDSVNEVKDKHKGSTLRVRVNTNGGDVDYALGAVTSFAQYPFRKEVQVDSQAASMGLYYCCYASHVTATDFSTFLLHRAAYPPFVENNPDYFTADKQKSLTESNSKLRAALEAKIDVTKFKKITGYTLDQVFAMDSRIDVCLNAEEAKEIGLVDEIIQITPEKKAEIEAKAFEITAQHSGFRIAATTETPQPSKPNIMTIAELKAGHPALVAELSEAIAKEAAKKERARIKAWTFFHDVDKKAVVAGIDGGEELDQATMLELMEKKTSKKEVEVLEGDSTKEALSTDKPADKAVSKEAKAVADWKAGVMEQSTQLNTPAKK
jgi:ATP-dependent protease ClpP protease subunit